jgi:hypothetical protein
MLSECSDLVVVRVDRAVAFMDTVSLEMVDKFTGWVKVRIISGDGC